MKKETVQEFFKFTPHALLELITIDTSELEGNRLPSVSQILNYYNYSEDSAGKNVIFQGVSYKSYPIEFVGNEMKVDGTTFPRPKLRIANVNGDFSYYINQSGGIIGAKVTRKRVYAKHLHPDTFGGVSPFGNYDPDAEICPDVFFVEKILGETPELIELELSSSIDLEKIMVPRRRMFATLCGFEYRNSLGCGYSGPPKAGQDDKAFSGTLVDVGEWAQNTYYYANEYVYIKSNFLKEDGAKKRYYYVCTENHNSTLDNKPNQIGSPWKIDACSLKINGCLLRFSEVKDSQGLPFGGFPSLSRVELET